MKRQIPLEGLEEALTGDSLPPAAAERPAGINGAGLTDQLFFTWISPLMRTGRQRPLQDQDLPDLAQSDAAEPLLGKIRLHWEHELADNEQPSLIRAFMRAFGVAYLSTLRAGVCCIALHLGQALALGAFVDKLSDRSAHAWHLWAMAAAIVAISLLYGLSHATWYFATWRFGMRFRIAMTALLFEKALKLQYHSLQAASSGMVINLASNDIERFQKLGIYSIFVLVGPFVGLVLILYFLWQELGPSTLAAYALLFLLIPLQYRFSKGFARLRAITARLTDSRIQLTAQFLKAASWLKMAALEAKSERSVLEVRASEFTQLQSASRLRAFNHALHFMTPPMIGLFAFGTYSLTGSTLTLRRVFVSLTFFNLLQYYVSNLTIKGLEALAEALIAFQRLETFLLLPEVAPLQLQGGQGTVGGAEAGAGEKAGKGAGAKAKDEGEGGLRLTLVDVSCSWGGDSDTAAPESERPLRGLSLSFEGAENVCVIGSVGSGKTSLLLAILGELPCVRGRIDRRGAVLGYAAQEPFIVARSIRENITFGQPFDATAFDTAVRACALDPDLGAFARGAEELVGEGGVTLSGGQRARVSLCRLAYRSLVGRGSSPASYCLLDDVTAALDRDTEAHILKHCIRGVLGNCCCLMVTNSAAVVKQSSQIVVMDKGQVMGQFESYSGVLSCADAAHLLPKERSKPEAVEGEGDGANGRDPKKEEQSQQLPQQPSSSEEGGDGSGDGNGGGSAQSPSEGGAADDENGAESEIHSEDRAIGVVTGATYLHWVWAASASSLVWGAWVAGLVGAQALLVASVVWLVDWASLPSGHEQRQPRYLLGYLGLVGATAVLGVARSFSFYHLAVWASQRLHGRMLRAVLFTSTAFHFTNPIGRVLNRFSKDLGFMDDVLPFTAFECLQIAGMAAGSVALGCMASPYVTIAVLPLLWVFVKLRNFYLASSREVKRLEAVSRSPIYSLFSEMLAGLPTIRALDGSQRQWQRELRERLDANSRGYFCFLATSRWLGIRLDALVVVFLALVLVLSLSLSRPASASASAPASASSDAADLGAELRDADDERTAHAGRLGLAVTYALSLGAIFQWMVRCSAEVENVMISVERVLAYCALPAEQQTQPQQQAQQAQQGQAQQQAQQAQAQEQVAEDWPKTGALRLRNLRCRYRPELPLVLKGISCSIRAGERVGICGRTGAGKSTLLQALFRLVEPIRGG
eukprot:g2445.t1